jgi:hypothetical protein
VRTRGRLAQVICHYERKQSQPAYREGQDHLAPPRHDAAAIIRNDNQTPAATVTVAEASCAIST